MVFVEDASEGGDFLEEKHEEGNAQIPQPGQLVPAPVPENDIKVEEHGSPAPPPPPERQ